MCGYREETLKIDDIFMSSDGVDYLRNFLYSLMLVFIREMGVCVKTLPKVCLCEDRNMMWREIIFIFFESPLFFFV